MFFELFSYSRELDQRESVAGHSNILQNVGMLWEELACPGLPLVAAGGGLLVGLLLALYSPLKAGLFGLASH